MMAASDLMNGCDQRSGFGSEDEVLPKKLRAGDFLHGFEVPEMHDGLRAISNRSQSPTVGVKAESCG